MSRINRRYKRRLSKKNKRLGLLLGVPIILCTVFFATSFFLNFGESEESYNPIGVSKEEETSEHKENNFFESIFATDKKVDAVEMEEPNKEEESPITMELPFEIDSNPDSITVLINKELSLPKDYEPSDLVIPKVSFVATAIHENSHIRQVAAGPLEELFEDALENGIILNAVSGYRSYKRQYKIFTNNIKYKGITHTVEVSAMPGYSEHQTGLAMDVSSKSAKNQLEEKFGDTIEGKWLAEHAHEYGFIIRYAKDKTHITGYSYEPWHIRYVGKEVATYLYQENLSLEEFFGFYPTIDFDKELTYSTLWKYGIDINDVLKPTPTPVLPIEEPDYEDPEYEDPDLEDPDLDGELQQDDSFEDDPLGVDGSNDNEGTGDGKEILPTKIPREKSPTKSPTKVPTKAPTSSPDKEVVPTMNPTKTPQTGQGQVAPSPTVTVTPTTPVTQAPTMTPVPTVTVPPTNVIEPTPTPFYGE